MQAVLTRKRSGCSASATSVEVVRRSPAQFRGELSGQSRFNCNRHWPELEMRVEGIRPTGNRLCVQHGGTIRVCLHRGIEGKTKTFALKREADKWFVVVACDVDEPVKVGNIFPAVGLDVGLTHFATLSNGETIAGPQYLREELRELRRAQRSLSREKRGGTNRKKARRRVARIRGQHGALPGVRREFLLTGADLMNDGSEARLTSLASRLKGWRS